MYVGVLLLESNSGLLHLYVDDCEPQYMSSRDYWWTEGNGSCDCNRTLALFDFKIDLVEIDNPSPWNNRCGNTNIDLLHLALE